MDNDERVKMCGEVNYFGQYSGEFVPCIGAGMEVNYIYKQTVTTLPAEVFRRVHYAVMVYHAARKKYIEAAQLVDECFTRRWGVIGAAAEREAASPGENQTEDMS
jgi:hypothetical protein